MMGGLLPPLMLCLALAFALAFVPRPVAVVSAATAAAGAVAIWSIGPPATWTEPVFVGCWVSVIATAALSYWPNGIPPRLAPIAAANAGLWAGAVSATAGSGIDLAVALVVVLLAIPGRLIIDSGGGIALKIASSWLIAVAALAAMVSLTPTPGYAPDHMD
ncbi:MAG: hypothetical protein H0V46_08375 [Sphingomonas sp.]|nr:hypothetical protein [Sphingomonas sp.]